MSLEKSYAVRCDGVRGTGDHSPSCAHTSRFFHESKITRQQALKRGWKRVMRDGVKRDLSPSCAAAEEALV